MSSLNLSEFSYKKEIKMITRIRTSEVFIRDTFWNEKIFSFLHLSIGPEASAVDFSKHIPTQTIKEGL